MKKRIGIWIFTFFIICCVISSVLMREKSEKQKVISSERKSNVSQSYLMPQDNINDSLYRKYDGELINVESGATITINSLNSIWTGDMEEIIVVLIDTSNGESVFQEYVPGISYENVLRGSYVLQAYAKGSQTKLDIFPEIEISYTDMENNFINL